MRLLENTYSLLDASPLSLERIATGAGVGYWWLTKLKQRRFDDPGVGRVERLHDFLSSEAEGDLPRHSEQPTKPT